MTMAAANSNTSVLNLQGSHTTEPSPVPAVHEAQDKRSLGNMFGLLAEKQRAITNRISHHDIGIDLGTGNTIIQVHGYEEMIFPTFVTRHKASGEITDVGYDSKKTWGKVPEGQETVMPMSEGYLTDPDVTGIFLKRAYEFYLAERKIPRTYRGPRVIISIPACANEAQDEMCRLAVLKAFKNVRETYIANQALMALKGSRAPMGTSQGVGVADIGGGTLCMAFVVNSKIVEGGRCTIQKAGNAMTEAIRKKIANEKRFTISEPDAERLKEEIGCALFLTEEERTAERLVYGFNRQADKQDNIVIGAELVHEAINEVLNEIFAEIRHFAAALPPSMAEVCLAPLRGIYITGGSAKLKNLPLRFQQELGIRAAAYDEDPLLCGAVGIDELWQDEELLKELATKVERK